MAETISLDQELYGELIFISFGQVLLKLCSSEICLQFFWPKKRKWQKNFLQLQGRPFLPCQVHPGVCVAPKPRMIASSDSLFSVSCNFLFWTEICAWKFVQKYPQKTDSLMIIFRYLQSCPGAVLTFCKASSRLIECHVSELQFFIHRNGEDFSQYFGVGLFK